MNKKKIILDFIKRHKIAVLATVDSKGNPEAAVVEFGETNNLELIFDSLSNSRKYKNLKRNPKMAWVIGWDENITVQYEGIAHELKGKDLDIYKKIYFTKNPEAKRWEKFKEIRYFKVSPRWIRYSDLRTHPWRVFEIKFDDN